MSSIWWRLLVTYVNNLEICSCSGTVQFWAILSNKTQHYLFNGPLSGTTRVSRYQKGKTNLDLLMHQLGHMQICTSPQTDNDANIPPLSFYKPVSLPATQPL